MKLFDCGLGLFLILWRTSDWLIFDWVYLAEHLLKQFILLCLIQLLAL